MKKWILIETATGRCYDVAETVGEDIPFPVHESFVWADITEADPQPQTGWMAADNNGTWDFSDPTPPPPPLDKEAYLAQIRYAVEVGGMTFEGLPIATDINTQTKLLGAREMAKGDPEFSIRWKSIEGFVTLNAAQVIAISDAVGMHVQKCFAIEDAMQSELPGLNSEQAIEDRFTVLFAAS